MADNPILRPSVFIGSSSEGLPIAEAIQLNLDRACEAAIWSQGVFGLNEGNLESLVNRLNSFDFAILVLTPDDVTTSRDVTQQAPRDNVLLEIGLAIGALGRERSFIVYERGCNLKLPTDLAGITHANFQKHDSRNLLASLGAATTLIKGSIQQLGRRQQKISTEIDQNTQFQIIHDLLDSAPEQFLIWMHETNGSIDREHAIYGGGIRYGYLKHNRSGGSGWFSMDSLCNKLPDAGLLSVDLRNKVTLTLRGKQFAQWLVGNGHKATSFKSDIAEWGAPLPDGLRFPPPPFPDLGREPRTTSDGKKPDNPSDLI